MDEIRRLEKLTGQELNEAKRILAFEVTKLVHGEEEAKKAMETAESIFGSKGNTENMPSTTMELSEADYGLLDVMMLAKLIPSKGEGRRLIEQGGVSVNDEKITDTAYRLTADAIREGVVIKKGKKVYHRVIGE